MATFVMPHYSADFAHTRPLLERALDAIRAQSDPAWRLVLVDDDSPDPAVAPALRSMAASSEGRIHVLVQPANRGPGLGRNRGIEWAAAQGSPMVLFMDADDLAHPRWVEVARRALVPDEVDVVYTSFVPVDESYQPIDESRLTPSIRQILEAHRAGPPQGRDAWIRIVTDWGYVNPTCGTGVRTALALRFPFPAERISEDSHTWLRYSAGGGAFKFTPEAPFRYRIPVRGAGSSSRERAGGKRAFYQELIRVDGDGFEAALRIAVQRGRLSEEDGTALRIRYLRRLAETMRLEGQPELARQLLERAGASGESPHGGRTP